MGFLRSFAKMTIGGLIWPEGTLALLIGGGGGTAILNSTTVQARHSLVGDSIGLLGVLLGIVFAAYALLIALFSDQYIRLLGHARDGIAAFLRPFIFAVGLKVTAVFVTLGYRASALDLDSRVEVAAFLAWAFLLSFTLLDVVALARNVSLHGMTRARQADAGRADHHAPPE